MDADEREEPEDEGEAEDPAVTHRLGEYAEPERPPIRGRRMPLPRRRRSTAWVALVLLLASIYVFWVLPYQLGSHPVQVEFSQDKK